MTGSRMPEILTPLPVSPPSLSPAQNFDTSGCVFFPFSFEDIFTDISIVFWY